MGRLPSRPSRQDHQLAVRVSAELMAAIDREVERLKDERPGSRVQRSDAVREILHQALLADHPLGRQVSRRRSTNAEKDE